MGRSLKQVKKGKTSTQLDNLRRARETRHATDQNKENEGPRSQVEMDSSSEESESQESPGKKELRVVLAKTKAEVINGRKREVRAKDKLRKAKNELREQQKTIQDLEHSAAYHEKLFRGHKEEFVKSMEKTAAVMDKVRESRNVSQKEKYALIKKGKQMEKALKVQNEKNQDSNIPTPFTLKHENVYTAATRALARQMVGVHKVTDGHVGPLIRDIGSFLGVDVQEDISPHTVRSVVYEETLLQIYSWDMRWQKQIVRTIFS
jgi:hypothetical protein